MKQNKKLALALLLSFSLVGIFKVAVPAKGFVDNAPPEITSFSITPLEFDTSEASQTITITLGISDSGVGFCPSSVPGCPSSGTSFIWMHINPMIGNSSQDLLIGDPARISGDANSGVYQITKVVPYGSKDGVWQVSSISLADTLGNHTEYVPTNPGAHQLDLDAIPNATGLQIANTATN